MLRLCLSKGVSLDTPPTMVTPISSDPECHELYRPSPYLVQAACKNNVEIFKDLVNNNCSLNDVGYIGLSRARKNAVASNVVGAAAFHGNWKVLEHILSKTRGATDLIDVPSMESADR